MMLHYWARKRKSVYMLSKLTRDYYLRITDI